MSSKFGWEEGDIEIVEAPKKSKSYAEAARLLAIVQRAGARHSATDRTLVQQLHDIAMELGAECYDASEYPEGYHDEAETLTADDLRRYAPNPMLKAAVEALVLRHPGHANQKTHGNRFGAGQAKESLRRLKDDKGAREAYKESARGRGQGSGNKGPKTLDDVLQGLDLQHDKIKAFQRIYSAPKSEQSRLMSEFLAHTKARSLESGRRSYEIAHGKR